MPNDFYSLDELADRLLHFQKRYENIAKPFQWKFTRDDLSQLLSRLASESATFSKAAYKYVIVFVRQSTQSEYHLPRM
jgi:hypothetical protein